MKNKTLTKEIVFVLILTGIILMGTAAFTWIVMQLWNIIFTDVVLVKQISFWQALGLIAMLHIASSGVALFVKSIWYKA